MTGGHGDQRLRCEAASRHLLIDPQGTQQVVGVVGEPAGGVEQLPDGDVLAAWDGTGQPLLQAVVQPQLALADQLQDHRGHKGLGHAADPEPITRPCRALGVQVTQAAGPLSGSLASAD